MKWLNPTDAKAPPPDVDVLISVSEPDNVEVQQSAEILYREFRHHGVRALLDACAAAGEIVARKIPLTLVISGVALESGDVEIRVGGDSSRVKLEDAVERVIERLRGKGKPE